MFVGRPPYVEQLNDMAFWFPIVNRLARMSTMPKLEMIRTKDNRLTSKETPSTLILRVPKTVMFYVEDEVMHILDGKKTPQLKKLVSNIDEANKKFSGESFLRTGQTSNKHEWNETCHLTLKSDLLKHVYSLMEFSAMVDLPCTSFAVREMIPTVAVTVAFNNMPIAREVRMFAKEGEVMCAHPYWPSEAFESDFHPGNNVTDEQISELQEMPDMTELNKLAEYVSKSFLGPWSLDFLQDVDGNWWLTDMALASTSYHWPGCENNKEKES